jgi:hypothetical protein
MNSPIPGEFYLFLPSLTLSEARSFPKSFPKKSCQNMPCIPDYGHEPARLSLDFRRPDGFGLRSR